MVIYIHIIVALLSVSLFLPLRRGRESGHEPTALYLSFVRECHPGPEQCSVAQMFENEFMNHCGQGRQNSDILFN